MLMSTTGHISGKPAKKLTLTPDDYIHVPSTYAFARGDKFLPLPISQAEEERFNRKLIQGYELLMPEPSVSQKVLALCQSSAAQLAESSSIKAINEGEREIASKMSIQRRFPPYYFAIENRLEEGKPTPLLELCLDAYVKKISSLNAAYRSMSPIELMMRDSDPFDTNQGAPTFSKDPAMRFLTCSALGLKGYNAKDIIARSRELCVNVGLPDYCLWPAAIARRSGPVTKPQRYYRSHSDGLSCVSDSEVQGVYTRGRKVFMMPFYFNMLVSPVAYAMKQGRTAVLGFGHDAESERRYLEWFTNYQDYEVAESDLSGYDLSIKPAYRKLLWSICRKYGYNETALDLLMEYEDNTVVMSPPWNSLQSGSAAVVIGGVGLLSGLKVTTEVGSAISAAANLKALIKCKVVSEQDVTAGNWPKFLMLGDDILGLNKKGAINKDIFEESYAEDGLTVKYAEGYRFLMNHIYNGKKFGVASRVIQQTAFNEDSYFHEGQIMLALAARITKPFFPEHWHLLQSWAAGMSKLVATSEPFAIMASSGDQSAALLKLMAHPSIGLFLQSRIGESWFSELSRKAVNTGVHSDLYDMLRSKGYSADAPTTIQRSELVRRLLGSTAREKADALKAVLNHVYSIR